MTRPNPIGKATNALCVMLIAAGRPDVARSRAAHRDLVIRDYREHPA